jgi:hypothetical protein
MYGYGSPPGTPICDAASASYLLRGKEISPIGLPDEESLHHLRSPALSGRPSSVSAAPAVNAKDRCQSASNFDPHSASSTDPRSASSFDLLERRVRAVALAPSELVGVAETGRARVGV